MFVLFLGRKQKPLFLFGAGIFRACLFLEGSFFYLGGGGGVRACLFLEGWIFFGWGS